jgi:hypothetical protein
MSHPGSPTLDARQLARLIDGSLVLHLVPRYWQFALLSPAAPMPGLLLRPGRPWPLVQQVGWPSGSAILSPDHPEGHPDAGPHVADQIPDARDFADVKGAGDLLAALAGTRLLQVAMPRIARDAAAALSAHTGVSLRAEPTHPELSEIAVRRCRRARHSTSDHWI